MTMDELVEQWLLTAAITFPCPMGYVFPVVEGLALNMIEVLGVDSEQYASALLALWDSRKIKISPPETERVIETRAEVCDLLDRLVRLDQHKPNARMVRYARRGGQTKGQEIVRDPSLFVTFELTELGGESWEAFAEPDWTRFLDQLTDENTGEMTSVDLNLMMAYMGWFPPFAEHQVKRETVRVERVADYAILYWKRLPQVYLATFELETSTQRWQDGRIDGPTWFRDWWSATAVWYKKPWELNGWPKPEA